MRAVFFGTPTFAVPALDALLERHQVALVVTQPDRPAGRGLELRPSPVALQAEAAGVAVIKPPRAREPQVTADVEAARPEVLVVAAYGQVLPPSLLEAAPHGAINVHASLLPRWRGASPISAAILAGDRQTGVSIMQMDRGLDTGAVILQRSLTIGDREDAESLSKRLSLLGAEALLEALEMISAGTVQAQPQPEVGVTYAGLVKKSDGRLDWTVPAEEIERALRAYRPWPGVRLPLGDDVVQVLAGSPVPAWWADPRRDDVPPGTVVDLTGEGMVVTTSSTPFLVQRLRPDGRRDMSAVEYARGRRGLVPG